MTTVAVRHLSKSYDAGVAAVHDVSFDVGGGELIALLGPSGCGKTTILKMIAGLLAPTAGDIQFDGASVVSIPPERRGAVMVFQNHLLFPYLTVADNVAFGLKMRGVPRSVIQDRLIRMLDLVRLKGFEGRRPAELSGGQQQRVALARALVTEPRLLLLDEPFSNLDAHLRDEMRELVRRLQQKIGITTIFVTHDQQEAVILADRIALVFEGRLQQYGEPRLFYQQPATRRIAEFFGSANFLEGVKRGSVVTTAIGALEVEEGSQADGDVVVTIRSEGVELRADRENTFAGVVKRRLYTGSNTRMSIDVRGVELHLLAAPDVKYLAGEMLSVCLPRERLVVLMKDAPGELPTSQAGAHARVRS
jgi:ABC-type Fe3+/spermidine/putrescine transport system ATPase subunit